MIRVARARNLKALKGYGIVDLEKSMVKRISWWAVAIVGAWACVAAPPPASAQSTNGAETVGPTPSRQGPTREARAATAHGYLEDTPASPRLMPRYLAFQRDFAHDFGVGGTALSSGVDPLLALQARLEQRWGGSTVYEWLERGLALYARFQASTRMEKKGFDIKVQTGDVADGKLGVHMSRPLGSSG